MSVNKDELLTKLHKLPSMPLVVQAVLSSFKDDNLDSNGLAHLLEQDQGLSAKVLRVANSSFYGLPRSIASIQEAVVVMGFNSVRSLVLSAGIVHAFPSTPGSLFDRQAYWRRCFRVAGYAKALARSLGQDQEVAFTAAMFHEIGQLVLDASAPEQFSRAFQVRDRSGLSLIEAEQAEFGFDHAAIGADLASHWNFPAEIEHAIRYWRTPEREPFEGTTGLVHVAVLLESGVTGDDLMSQLPKKLRDRLGISWERIEAGLPDTNDLDADTNLILAP